MSYTMIENQLYAVERYLMPRIGYDSTQRAIDPLRWYIATGRASNMFLQWFVAAKPFVVGRILQKDGSYDDIIWMLKTKAGIN